MRTCGALLAIVLPLSAWAHDADLVYATVRRVGPEVTEMITLTASTLARLAPVGVDQDQAVSEQELEKGRAAIEAGVWDSVPLRSGGKPCERRPSAAFLRTSYLELTATFRCPPGELSQTFRILSVLPAGYRVVLASEVEGTRHQAFAQGDEQTVVMASAESPPAAVSKDPGAWVKPGIVHLLGGVDHLCLLAALLLVGATGRSALGAIAAFTAGHAVSGALVNSGLVPFNPAWQTVCEAALALAIAYLALENLVLKPRRVKAAFALACGVVHGVTWLGGGLVPLLGFTTGLLLGQAAAIAVLVPVLRLVSRRPALNRWGLRGGSAALAVAGGIFFVRRLVG